MLFCLLSAVFGFWFNYYIADKSSVESFALSIPYGVGVMIVGILSSHFRLIIYLSLPGLTTGKVRSYVKIDMAVDGSHY